MDYFKLACDVTDFYKQNLMKENKMEMENQGTKLSDLADVLISWKLAKENAEENLKNANQKIREVEQVIYAKMQEEEIEQFAHGGQLFYPYVNSFPRVAQGREDEYFAWLEEHGEAGVIKRVIHPQTHRSWWKNHEEFTEELTEKGLVEVHEEIRIGTRKK